MMGNRHLRITVDGKAYDVHVEVIEESANGNQEKHRKGRNGDNGAAAQPRAPRSPDSPPAAAVAPPGLEGNVIAAPLAGVVIELLVSAGDAIEQNQPVIKTESMKMLASVNATRAGTVKEILVAKGETVIEGQPVLRME